MRLMSGRQEGLERARNDRLMYLSKEGERKEKAGSFMTLPL